MRQEDAKSEGQQENAEWRPRYRLHLCEVGPFALKIEWNVLIFLGFLCEKLLRKWWISVSDLPRKEMCWAN